MYLVDGVVFKAQRSKTSGRVYALRLVVDGDAGSFQYDPGAIRGLRPEHRMSIEQAREFGHEFGVCCVCGATLTDPKSIEAGIGPICAGRVA
jgi:hypothetical protein